VSAFLSGDQAELNPEELMLLANCNFEQVESKQSLMNKVAFFIDVCKIILDTLRQNSKMIDFYNQTAQRVFDFCCKYNYRVEYVRVAETLHSHFNQIIKISKHPELSVQSKIPFPIRLDEEDALQKVLELRYHQLKLSLELKIWSDAFRTTENIYQLINR
jgi:translation initiation factor 3 subunit A